jgi:hypothetical protein
VVSDGPQPNGEGTAESSSSASSAATTMTRRRRRRSPPRDDGTLAKRLTVDEAVAVITDSVVAPATDADIALCPRLRRLTMAPTPGRSISGRVTEAGVCDTAATDMSAGD